MKPMKIYVAGPLNSDAVGYLQNVHNMIQASNEVRRRGHSPFVPCNDLLEGIVDGRMEYDDYFNMSQPWLEASDAILFLAHSPGASKELETAKKLGLIIYEDVDEIPPAGKYTRVTQKEMLSSPCCGETKTNDEWEKSKDRISEHLRAAYDEFYSGDHGKLFQMVFPDGSITCSLT